MTGVNHQTRCSRASRTAGIALAMAAGAAITGCRTYQPAPFEPSEAMSSFLQRTPDTAEFEAFAARLGEASPPGRFAVDDGLSLQEAEVVALFFNPELRTARASARVSEVAAAHAGLWPDPTLGLEWTHLLESSLNPNELFGTLGFTIPISGRLEVEKERLGAAHAEQLFRVAADEWAVRIGLREQWSEWTAARALAETAEAFVVQVDALREVVEAMERLGELTRVEARLFHLERLQAEFMHARFAADERAARLAIEQSMGLPPRSSPPLVAEPMAAVTPGLGEADLRALALERSPQLSIVTASYEVAEKSLEEAIRAQWPDLGLTPGYGSQDGIRQFTLGFSLPIPIFNGNRQAIEVAFADREQAQLEVDRTVQAIVAASALACERLAAASQQREIVERDLAPLAEKQYAEARELARLGEVDTFILLEGLKQQFETRITLIESLRDERLAAIALEAIAGPEPTVDRLAQDTESSS